MIFILHIHLLQMSKNILKLKQLYFYFFLNKLKTLFKKFDEKRNDYLEEFDVAKIYEFIVLNSIPTILDFDNKAA